MDGNRGAKGSIKDRLINILYKIRYGKKSKKANETKKIDNLTKKQNYIRNLEEFKVKDDINVLPKNDKKILDDVKLNENNYKEVIKTDKIKKVGIDDSQLKSDSSDIKKENIVDNKVNTDKVNLEVEFKKTRTEIIILKTVEDFVNNTKSSLKEIKNEISDIKKCANNKNQDINELNERYNKLQKKIEEIKDKYYSIKDKYDLSELNILNDIELAKNICNYKTMASLDEVENIIDTCKNKIEEIKEVEIVVKEEKDTKEDIKNLENDQNKVKIKFNFNKDDINTIKSVENDISYELNKQKEIVDDMYDKASYYEKQISKKLEIIGHKKILSSLIKIAGGILTLPLTGVNLFGISMGSTMINKALKEMNKSLETREKIVINYKYEDISKQINGVKDKLEYTNLVLCDSLNEIKKLKDNFNNIFKNYNEVLPEFIETLKSVNSLEEKLLNQQSKLNKMNEKLDIENELNQQKLEIVKKR